MKKSFWLIGCVILACMCSSCGSGRMFMLNTNGIATYNRNTGQFEVLWEWAESQPKVLHDTIYVDSCKVQK